MAKKAATKKRATTKKKNGPNRSEEIRKASEVVGNSPKAVMELLASKGMTVSPALVSNVLTRAKKKSAKGKKRGRKPGKPTNGHVDMSALIVAKKLVAACGGSASEAKQAVEAYSKLSG